MHFTSLALAAAIPALVAAQGAKNLTVEVGASGLTFTNNNLENVPVGSQVQFIFHAKNHSVVRSTFTNPCQKSTDPDSFASPFFPVSANETKFPTYTVNVTSADPIWYYCSQGAKTSNSHCVAGMVGVINPPPDKSITAFIAAAKSSSSAANTTSPSGSSPPSGSSSAPTGTSAPTPTRSNAAMKATSGSASLLALMGIIAGLTF